MVDMMDTPVFTHSETAATETGKPAHAWITRLPEGLRTTEQGRLAGLTFAAKDNIDVAGVPTTVALSLIHI